MAEFTDKADFEVRFQPFQLYPELPRLDPDGVDKQDFFNKLTEQRAPGADPAVMKKRFQFLQGEWKKDGLRLEERNGSMGNSFDAQRLISFARKQGREDQMIEAIYTANHENNLCLSSLSVLLECAEKAGITGAAEMLNSNAEVDEVFDKIQMYREAGINSVPVLLFNEKFPLHGAPEGGIIREAFKGLIEKGDAVDWPPKGPPPKMDPREFVQAALAVIDSASKTELGLWSKMTQNLDWGLEDPRWLILKEKIPLKGDGIRDSFGAAIGDLQALLRSVVNPKWHATMRNIDVDAGQ